MRDCTATATYELLALPSEHFRSADVAVENRATFVSVEVQGQDFGVTRFVPQFYDTYVHPQIHMHTQK
jgi:hypothetical protein